MRNNHPIILAAVAGIALVGIIVLACLGRPVPDVLGLVATTAAGALAGVILPTAASTVAAAVERVTTTPAAAPPTDGLVTVAVAPGPPQGAPRSAESHETAPARTVTPGMSPVEARQAGGS